MTIDFKWPQNFSRSSFIIAPCNSDAFHILQSVDKWPKGNLLISGPPFSGKTHLSKIFLSQNPGQKITKINFEEKISSCCVVDSLESLTEKQIMNIFYRTQPFNIPVLWLSRHPRKFSLNDLNTRFNSIFSINILEPDEKTFKAVFAKRCLDFGLIINEEMLEYITRRVEIKYDSINTLILKLNSYCLKHIRPPSIPILSRIIHGFDNEYNFIYQLM